MKKCLLHQEWCAHLCTALSHWLMRGPHSDRAKEKNCFLWPMHGPMRMDGTHVHALSPVQRAFSIGDEVVMGMRNEGDDYG